MTIDLPCYAMRLNPIAGKRDPKTDAAQQGDFLNLVVGANIEQRRTARGA